MAVSGSFNQWDRRGLPLQRARRDGGRRRWTSASRAGTPTSSSSTASTGWRTGEPAHGAGRLRRRQLRVRDRRARVRGRARRPRCSTPSTRTRPRRTDPRAVGPRLRLGLPNAAWNSAVQAYHGAASSTRSRASVSRARPPGRARAALQLRGGGPLRGRAGGNRRRDRAARVGRQLADRGRRRARPGRVTWTCCS